jgi:hypothetical protein
MTALVLLLLLLLVALVLLLVLVALVLQLQGCQCSRCRWAGLSQPLKSLCLAAPALGSSSRRKKRPALCRASQL